MKYQAKLLPLLAFLLLLAGCGGTSTLTWTPPVPGQTASTGEPVLWNLDARNKGVYLFYWIPVWTGYAARPNRNDYELFETNLRKSDLRRQLSTELENLNADKVVDISYTEYVNGWIGLGIFWMRSVRATGVAVKYRN